jgi:hypothetical protein
MVMRLLKQAFAVMGAIGMVAAIAAVVAPRAMSAVVATLVRDVDNPARDSFEATVAGSSCEGPAPLVCTGGLPVPTTNGAGAAVSMLVIEHVSGVCGASQSTMLLTNYPASQIVNAASTTVVASPAGYFVHLFPPVSGSSGFSQPTRIYAAAGSTLVSVNSTPGNCNFFVSGYLVTP